MAQIKLNSSFTDEVSAFRTAGDALDSAGTGNPSEGSLSLPTVSEYQERLRKIRYQIWYLQFLVQKDAKDMDALAAALNAADGAAGNGAGGGGGGAIGSGSKAGG